jgi:hypothetical protein
MWLLTDERFGERLVVGGTRVYLHKPRSSNRQPIRLVPTFQSCEKFGSACCTQTNSTSFLPFDARIVARVADHGGAQEITAG